jgi:hypothetical protein
MERVIRIEVRFERAGRDEKHAEVAAKVAGKATVEAVLRSFGMTVTETSSDSFPGEPRPAGWEEDPDAS